MRPDSWLDDDYRLEGLSYDLALSKIENTSCVEANILSYDSFDLTARSHIMLIVQGKPFDLCE